MRSSRSLLRGFIAALISIGILIGGISLSLAEGNLTNPFLLPLASPTSAFFFSPTMPFSLSPLVVSASPSVTLSSSLTLTATSTPSSTLGPGSASPAATSTTTGCGKPSDWIPYTILHGDTLYSLARYYYVTVSDLQQANCMGTTTLLVTGAQIYVPAGPTRTISPTPPSATPSFTRTQVLSTASRTPTATASATSSNVPTGNP